MPEGRGQSVPVVVVSVLIGLGHAGFVTAYDFPRMIGAWKQTPGTVVLGNALHHKDQSDSNGQVQGRIVDTNIMAIVYTQIGSLLITSHVVFSRN